MMYTKRKKSIKNNLKDFNDIKNKLVMKQLKSKYPEDNDIHKNFGYSRNLSFVLSHSLRTNSMI